MSVFAVLCFMLSIGVAWSHFSDTQRKTYIVYMGDASSNVKQVAREQHHHGLLLDAIGEPSTARKALIYSYGRSINGFAAKLLPHEAAKISESKDVISVFPSTIRKLQTTRSWDFMGMVESLTPRNYKSESNIIVGLIDTGIYMNISSFDDKGYGPVPRKWKGICDKAANFTGCNRKVIGARYFDLDYTEMSPTPSDTDGHGTHTSSTAAGNAVVGASLYGIANGTARGGVPNARIASYKICGDMGCSDASMLAAFDSAIADGVDVISLSIGGQPMDFTQDTIAIGSFHAMMKGVLTVCAAGNTGPWEASVSNVAPWVITVGATNMDRQFWTKLKLGNGMEFNGRSVNTFSPKERMFPLTHGNRAFNATDNPYLNGSECNTGTVVESVARGKMILCLGNDNADRSVKIGKGIGCIMAFDEVREDAVVSVLPATMVSARDGITIAKYINSTKSPQAYIYRTITDNNTKAPVVAYFSSRGPQKIAPYILKPDMVAPGTDIVAGYSKLVAVTEDPTIDTRVSSFNILSGTSMSCPHVSGAAAYVLSFHPDWSPAAVKSALMTTSRPVNGSGTENGLATGAGLLNPRDAVHPGLVYDLSMTDYVKYLCKEGYNSTKLAMLIGDKMPKLECSHFKPALGVDGLNYPSMHLQLSANQSEVSETFHRTVTNVGYGASTYNAKVTAPKGLFITVIPKTLRFKKTGQKQSFNVMVSLNLPKGKPATLTAFLEWNDSKHRVRSPIVVYRSGN